MEFLRAKTQCSLQDLGRYGWRHWGIGGGGAMDPLALQLANIMVGNAPEMAAVEMILPDVIVKFHHDAMAALCGQGARAQLADQTYWSGSRFHIPAGSELRITATGMGLTGYLAVRGGFDVEPVMGSWATDLRSRIGPHHGLPFKKHDVLPLRYPEAPSDASMQLRMPVWDSELGILPGPEWSLLPEKLRHSLLRRPWRVSQDSDRTGMRLRGRPLPWRGCPHMRSHGVFPGVIQLPADGYPIVLTADAQATGGYPRIATICHAHLWKMGQALPGTRVYFSLIDEAQAAAALAQQQHYCQRIKMAVAHTH